MLIIYIVNSQWVIVDQFLYGYNIYQYSTCCRCSYSYTEYFREGGTSDITANFITCKQPSISYITLDSTFNTINRLITYNFQSGYFISFDLYFQGKWDNDKVVFQIGSFFHEFKYSSPDQYPITQGFCDSLQTDVRTINFILPSTQSGQINFKQSNTNTGSVSIRTIMILKKSTQCYPSCSSCTGPEKNQCTSCFSGAPTNNQCPSCSNGQYYEKQVGCRSYCKFEKLRYSNGFCQEFEHSVIVQFDNSISSAKMLRWQLIYDPLHVDTSPKYIYAYHYVYGIFKYYSGIGRLIQEISTSTITYSYGMRIKLILFNNLQLGGGIRFLINNTYYSSIYKDSQGIQTHGIKISEISQISNIGACNSYSYCYYYDLYMFVDIPQYQFYFSAIGNFTDSTVGWGLISLHITNGLCPLNCQICEVSYQCKKCKTNFYFVGKDGNCIYGCSNPPTLKIVGDYCQDLEDQIPYSKYLMKYDHDAPDQYSQYQLLSQKGVNFLKGEDILYSYWNNIRVFGGQYVWSQAVFQRIYQIDNPHHSITIQFQIIFGPSFPSESRFICTIDDNLPFQYSKSSQSIIRNKIAHSQNILTIKWECYGEKNEPIQAYCGFYYYYIVVHYCQPYCLKCTDQNTCLEWEQYDKNLINLSQNECQSEQFYDNFQLKCIDCPSQCLTCKSQIDCITCKSTYILTKLGCVCEKNQYEFENQCVSCPQQCEQCLNQSFCLQCSITKFRTLLNGECVCLDGYYSVSTNPQCLRCHLLCKTCSGPNECLECQNISNIEKVDSICKCKQGTAYEDSLNTCAVCHQTCLTCFRTTINGCLTCDFTQKRILRGLKCECEPGYYEVNNNCTNCPNDEDSSLQQCYNLCNNNQKIWHTIICSVCNTGQILIKNNCQPQCGDSQIELYEECEDDNNILDDLCYNCQFQCPKHCQSCDQTTTLPCPDICGDGIISGDEECEDGNNIQYDGCYNCKYQCQSACTKCILGKCFECLTLGWYTDTSTDIWTCKEKCGDELIVGSEQCEDNNTIDTDGCHNCRYFCRKGCSSCDFSTNTCLSCEEPGYQPEQYYCKNICGDGLLVKGLYGFFSERYVNLFVETLQNQVLKYVNQGIYYLIEDAKIVRQSVKVFVSIVIQMERVVQNVNLDTLIQIMYVILYVETQQLLKMKNVTMETQFMEMVAISVDLVVLNHVLVALKEFVINMKMRKIKPYRNVYQFQGQIWIQINKYAYYLVNQSISMDLKLRIYFNVIINVNFVNFKHAIFVNKVMNQPLISKNVDNLLYFQSNQNIVKQVLRVFVKNVKIMPILIQLKIDVNYFLILILKNQIKINNVIMGIIWIINKYVSHNVEMEFLHKKKNVKFRMKIDLCLECEMGYQYDIMNKQCGIYREYGYLAMSEDDLNYKNCQLILSSDCLICEQGICLKCKQNYFLINGLCKDIQTFQEIITDYDTNFDQYDNESSYDNYQQELCDQNCDKCKDGICEQCKKDFQFNSIIKLCQSSDIIQYIQLYIEDTLQDTIINDYQYYCQLLKNQIYLDYQFQAYNVNCLHQIQQNQQLDKYDYVNENDNFFCNSNCLFCNFGICSLCLEGSYIFNNECIQNGIVQYYQNESICGDKLIQMGEVCDDGNEIQYDGCFQCQFSCDQYCNNCILGICYSCEIGFVLIFQICEPYCGDGLVVPFTNEECDDENELQADGCDLCKFECVANCLKCNQVHCKKCEKGFENKNEICISICGDGIVIPEYEQCDDSNNIMYDGCFNCQYQCSQDCLQCSKGICLLSCPNGRIVVDGACLFQCGQLMVNYDIECYDGNDIDNDGCFECKYKCVLGCHTCNKGICTQCIQGYILLNQQCYEFEHEDDFSSILENSQNNWICKNFECAYSESPKLQFNNLGMKNEQYLIKINFDQEVRCDLTECQEIFNIYIKEIEGDLYKIQCTPFEDQEFQNQITKVEYIIVIELFHPISIKPTLIVEPLLEIFNSNNQSVNLTDYKLTLNMPMIVEQSQKLRSVQMQITSKAVVITSISFGVLSIISGESTFMMELLNIVQYQSFLKFINQEYPENLLIYFQASEMISVGPYLQIFNIDQFINPILQKDEFIQLEGKFLYYELEASLFTNVCPQIFQTFGIVLIMFSGKILKKVFEKLMSNQFLISFLQNNNNLYSKVVFKSLKGIRKGIKLLQIQKYYFNYKQIKLLLLLNSWDLLFKSILYLYSDKSQCVRNTIEFTLSLGIITTYLYVLIDCFQSCKPNKLIDKIQRLDQIFLTLELCRTFFFSIVLIIVQENQVLQTLLLFIGSFSQCFFIYKFKQVDKFAKILSILIEGTVSIFILTSIIYFNTIRQYINQDILATVGFFHIGLLLLSSIILGLKQTIFTIKLFVKKFLDTKPN
ncbi:unnamed protein product [Paramecium pentaurelia]|uniref:EGF-like domain-containing protein n=1 Tax=Paramecium pentaurelia TaxID=43138 RepID=A0A8S1Y2J0_9CILI|nr:unnamed protein product [Paramecium pentaurelia]